MTEYIAERDSDDGASKYRRKKDCDYRLRYSHGISVFMQITIIYREASCISFIKHTYINTVTYT